ncbi:MAG TPA: hypothetical protein VFS42_10180, partial [Burkholderiaceae bacterium]|nr:hypothetical protein [Burkholderiaceae bacterium]
MAYAGYAAARDHTPSFIPPSNTVSSLRPGWWIARTLDAAPLTWQRGSQALLIAGEPHGSDGPLSQDFLEVLAQRLAREGVTALGALRGGYALAWVDANTHTVLLAIDRMG